MKRRNRKRVDGEGSHPSYLQRVTGLNVRPGEVAQVVVAHDAHCALLAGASVCTCVPDVTLVGEDATKADVALDGALGPKVRPS